MARHVDVVRIYTSQLERAGPAGNRDGPRKASNQVGTYHVLIKYKSRSRHGLSVQVAIPRMLTFNSEGNLHIRTSPNSLGTCLSKGQDFGIVRDSINPLLSIRQQLNLNVQGHLRVHESCCRVLSKANCSCAGNGGGLSTAAASVRRGLCLTYRTGNSEFEGTVESALMH